MIKCTNFLIESSSYFNVLFAMDLTLETVLYMIENWKKILGMGSHYGALLTDLSKAFDCIMDNLLISKLQGYGFDSGSINFV